MSAHAPAQAKSAPAASPATAARTGVLQRKCACGGSAGVTGECEACRKKRLALQTKLAVNAPGDVYEQEADRVANEVLAMPAHATVTAAPRHIQRLSGNASSPVDAPASVDAVIASAGRPLEAGVRQDMERRFGHDLSRVRIHTDSSAAQSARDVGAHAYTVGNSIVFDTGRFAPDTQQGRRLLAHELTHVQQQSTGPLAPVVQRQPNVEDWSVFENTNSGDPRFVFWAKRNAKPPKTFGEEYKLWQEYKRVEGKREVLEAYDRDQSEKIRAEFEQLRQAKRAAGKEAVEAKFARAREERERTRIARMSQLETAIKATFRDRSRNETIQYTQLAIDDAARRLPLSKALRKHWASDQQRWLFIRQYYRAYSKRYPDDSDVDVDNDDVLARYVALAEETYLDTLARDAAELEMSLYRTGISGATLAHLKQIAASRPMNPLENFEPGIHDYTAYQGQPGSVEEDVVEGDFDESNITLKYSDGRKLDIPLGQKNLLFRGKQLDPTKVLRIFTRRHKASQRLIPFVIYETTPGVDLDMLSEEDLALLGWPRFDDLLTPGVMSLLSPENKLRKLNAATLQLAGFHALGLGLRQAGVPVVAGSLRTGTALVTSTLRTGSALTTAATRQISISVARHGYSMAAVSNLKSAAISFTLVHAVEITTGTLAVADIAISLGGGDMGVITPGDQISMAVAEVRAAGKAAVKQWQLLEGEIKEVNFATKQAKLHITNLAYITDKTAKVEFDLGRKLVLMPKPGSIGKVLASEAVSGNHMVKASREGITLCSPDPCPLLRTVYKKELTPALDERLRHAEDNRLVNPQAAAAEAAEIREELELARQYASGGLPRVRRTVTQYQRDLQDRGLWGQSRIGRIAERELARKIAKVLPPTTSVDMVATEGSEAGIAQGRAAARKGTIVNLEVEARIDLPNALRKRAGLYVPGPGESRVKGSFKPDDIEFLTGSSYRFKDHKEVETIWEESFYSSEKARDKLRELLFRDLEIARALQPNCKGFAFTTNDKKLKGVLAELIADLPKDARALLHTP